MSELRDKIDESMTEKEFNQQVIELARLCGWLVYHTWTSIHSANGFPDLCLVKKLFSGDIIALVVEEKSEKGKISTFQIEWLELLGGVNGIFAFIWIPSQFDEIVKVLQARGIPDVIKVWKKHVLFAKSRFGLNLAIQTKWR